MIDFEIGFRAADAYTARHLHDEVGVAAADEVVHVGVVANEKPHDVAEAPASAHTQKTAPTNKNKRNYKGRKADLLAAIVSGGNIDVVKLTSQPSSTSF